MKKKWFENIEPKKKSNHNIFIYIAEILELLINCSKISLSIIIHIYNYIHLSEKLPQFCDVALFYGDSLAAERYNGVSLSFINEA